MLGPGDRALLFDNSIEATTAKDRGHVTHGSMHVTYSGQTGTSLALRVGATQGTILWLSAPRLRPKVSSNEGGTPALASKRRELTLD